MRYYKNLSIDETNCTVEKEGHPIHLTAMEYQLFVTLLDHSGRVCSRNLLLSSAWHITTPIQTRTVDLRDFHLLVPQNANGCLSLARYVRHSR